MSMDTPSSPTSPTSKSAKVAKTANGIAEKADTKITELARRAEVAAQRAEEILHDGVETLRVQSRAYADQAAEQIERAQQVVSERVRERPITGLMAAAGVGLLLGLILSSGRRH
jgi:ElaB/YqjD/DUF883 family membrane-anchored ribosome-binding protein